MEKRKLKVEEKREQFKDDNMESYTFIIPNDKFKNINIEIKKKDEIRKDTVSKSK